jgi:hypothetical protein
MTRHQPRPDYTGPHEVELWRVRHPDGTVHAIFMDAAAILHMDYAREPVIVDHGESYVERKPGPFVDVTFRFPAEQAPEWREITDPPAGATPSHYAQAERDLAEAETLYAGGDAGLARLQLRFAHVRAILAAIDHDRNC